MADGDVVSKFWDLIESAKVIVIIGDYDVDGVCASYIMSTSIKSVYLNKEIFGERLNNALIQNFF